MKNIVISLALLLSLCASAVAQEASSEASTASSSGMVLLKSGDLVVGGRVALGGVAGASFGFAANAEYGFKENIGIGGFFGYSGYKEDFAFYEASYTNILILGSVNYHQDFLKIQTLDTFLRLVLMGLFGASQQTCATVSRLTLLLRQAQDTVSDTCKSAWITSFNDFKL